MLEYTLDRSSAGSLAAQDSIPGIVTPREAGGSSVGSLQAWLSADAERVTHQLHKRGALLFRGFDVDGPDDFAKIVPTFGGQPLDYVGGAVPRTRINDIVFTSTEVTNLRRIRLHNELAYQPNYPDLILFFCAQPALQGGETPIADCRRIYKQLDPAVRQKFEERGIMYMRTFQNKRVHREWLKKVLVLYRHLTWQDAFKTADPAEVERLCCERGMDFAWRRGGDLSVSNVLPAVLRHPVTHEDSWFNQSVVQHFNRWSWGWAEYLFRRVMYPDPSAMPNQAYYGDGSEISNEEIRHVFEVTYRNSVEFQWQSGDILVLDNRLMAHGRNPFNGERRVYVSMLKQRRAAA